MPAKDSCQNGDVAKRAASTLLSQGQGPRPAGPPAWPKVISEREAVMCSIPERRSEILALSQVSIEAIIHNASNVKKSRPRLQYTHINPAWEGEAGGS